MCVHDDKNEGFNDSQSTKYLTNYFSRRIKGNRTGTHQELCSPYNPDKYGNVPIRSYPASADHNIVLLS